ncbi:DnaJ-like protein [Chromohalobacter marismortui]|uniref:DnaJ-like protein n=1 Tax=Chromohalobacter marismortui TaxID=42055 RepID=A0A4V3F429_9GAMM|nr:MULTISPECIES: J domain-containing protein [Chromohalobacter]MCI0511317.1 DnaJ domain-containing protein [Chromohalobacter sp.]MCI0594071.1 DnaJ domain-containing protein [Chromohalobacter sp.]TDU23666.1 DnaJ-like protein [Chromohalobacter marismortui]
MASSRFTPFERLLLSSRNEADTAALLLLAWLAMSDGQDALSDRKRALLDDLTGDFRHDHGHQLIVDLASTPDFVALQLAAEVLQRYYRGPRRETFLRQAIHVATHEGALAAGQHHVLRFLADLLGVAPERFEVLFRDVAGYPLAAPEDPSAVDHWQAREGAEPGGGARKKRRGADGERFRAHADDQESSDQGARAGRRQERQHRRNEHAKEEREENRQRRWRWRRDDTGHHERSRGGQRSGEGKRHHEGFSHEGFSHESGRTGGYANGNEKAQRALAVLGLMENAQKSDIKRAYRRLAQKYHPDRYHAQSQEAMVTASLRFQRIKNAYDYLMRQHA